MLLGGGSLCQQCGCKPQAECFESATPTENYDVYFDAADWMAGGIVVGDSSITLNQVNVYVGDFGAPLNADGSLQNSSDSPLCFIYSSNTPNSAEPWISKPLALIATLTPPYSFSGNEWTFTSSEVSLSANTIYWVVLTAGFYSAYWTLITYNDLTPTDSCFSLAATSGNSGFSFTQLDLNWRFKFDIA
jgi:hypothetical protein